MFWIIPVSLRIFVGNGVQAWLIKKVASQDSRETRFLLQYLFCFLIMTPLLLLFGQAYFDKTMWLILLIGFCNGWAAYCHWQAMHISMSRTSISVFLDDLIAMTLSYLILSEGVYLTVGSSLGIVFSLMAVSGMSLYSYYKKVAVGTKKLELNFLFYVVLYSIIWGLAIFSMKYFGIHNVHPIHYMWGWYTGALFSAILIFFLSKTSDSRVSKKGVLQVFLLSLCIMASLGSTFWAYTVAPLILLQPLFLIAEMILPALIGLYIFKEINKFDLNEKLLFGLGLLGGLLIAFNFKV